MNTSRWLIAGLLLALVVAGALSCRRDDGEGGESTPAPSPESTAPAGSTAAGTPTAGAATASPPPSSTPGLYGPGTTAGSIVVGGTERTFRVYVPASLDPSAPAPLVFMFHGGFGSGEQLQMRSSRMDEVADEEGFITVYPDGLGAVATWNAGTCCGSAVRKNVDDVGFVRALAEHLQASLNIDPRRIYAAGMSNGAGLAHRVACELADVFAAVGPVEGTLMTAPCNPSRPIAIMMIHGTQDLNIPWEGGPGCGAAAVPFKGVEETVAFWAGANACEGEAREVYAEGDGVCVARGECAGGADVVLCTIEGGDHSWPGGKPTRFTIPACRGPGHQSTTFPADRVLWQFFADHPMPASEEE